MVDRKTHTIRVMHFADTHFGVELYGKPDPATGMHSRLVDFRDALMRAIDLAVERGVSLAVFAGDAYRLRDPSQTHQREFARCLRALTDRGVKVVMVTGNHDVPNVRGRAHAMDIYKTLAVGGVEVVNEPKVLKVETRDGDAQIAAMPYLVRGLQLAREEMITKTAQELKRAMEARFYDWIEKLAGDCDPAIPTILLTHAWVSEARITPWQEASINVNEPSIQASALARPEFDYVALGHIHRHQDLNRHSQPPVVYSGSPYRMDFGERDEPKGFVYAEVWRGGAEYELVDVPSRALVDIDVQADGDDPTGTVVEEIRRHPIRDAIVRLTYRVPEESYSRISEKLIREALAPAYWIAGIRVEVLRNRETRSRVLTESLDPRTALATYLETSGATAQRREELMAYAAPLFEELAREEEVRP